MEWSTTSNVENMRVAFMPPPWLESNSNLFHSLNYDPYAGNSSTPVLRQTGPVISVQCPSNNDEMMVKKKKRLTNEQLASLEESFQEDIKLDTDRKMKLSRELGLQPRQIAVWFQNHRARWKVRHLEESYDSLRQEYDAVSRENQMLHDEVRKLRGIILKDHLMRCQSDQNSNQISGGSQIYGVGQYSIPTFVASPCCPPISHPPYPC
ncbi:hypothetical protein EUTSA_v10015784mg [Eutrema salsugineum]|uniref:Homeobox-leucine zipper protein n=1 Tax=Eutrema salsugineum TaxID=72664 RepID=V4KQT4_EUTSA|nr:putative homeobox-leucine zipper protein ATHB-51 [Eutrema salsugineum]ESQ40290.1 hypothetical protein EUTSA_v10015784mg [Eutrema salsugineum]